jgi:uncharacterized protein
MRGPPKGFWGKRTQEEDGRVVEWLIPFGAPVRQHDASIRRGLKTMKRTEDILSALRQAKPELTQRFGVKRLAIFGSYARGEQREDSDVDVLVEVDPSIGLRFVDLAERVEAIVGVCSEVVSRRAIKPRSWRVIEGDLIDVA